MLALETCTKGSGSMRSTFLYFRRRGYAFVASFARNRVPHASARAYPRRRAAAQVAPVHHVLPLTIFSLSF